MDEPDPDDLSAGAPAVCRRLRQAGRVHRGAASAWSERDSCGVVCVSGVTSSSEGADNVSSALNRAHYYLLNRFLCTIYLFISFLIIKLNLLCTFISFNIT